MLSDERLNYIRYAESYGVAPQGYTPISLREIEKMAEEVLISRKALEAAQRVQFLRNGIGFDAALDCFNEMRKFDQALFEWKKLRGEEESAT